MSKFLVLDDNIAFAENLAEIMADAGCDVIIADSGPRALEHIARERFDGIVSDMRMPEMSGAEVLRRARSIDPALPAVVVSAYSGADDLDVVAHAGVLGVLPKPVPVPRLLELLQHARRNGIVAVVDDDRELVDNLCEVLRRHGYAPVTASSVEDATALDDVPLFAAVVDVRMPGSPDGEAVRVLAERFPSLPLIVATGYPDAAPVADTATVLAKPVNPARLLETLDKLHTLNATS
jgi:DNA-binding NtrC family response regulator